MSLVCKNCKTPMDRSSTRRVQVTETFEKDMGSHGESFVTFAGVYCSMECVADDVAIMREDAGKD